MPRKRFYTVKEAAQALGLAESTIRRAIARGVLPARKIGARLNIIAPDDVERYRQERLGNQGWVWRRAPDYQPSRMAVWARNYRTRRKKE
ncbi:MAG TPA: helix-turn-helix domain-containing protein [Ktedonobacteraceae bacterium]|nr:helix-turn-helix domain-containing protein [Ktedonobacteraceae bacterium]